MSSHAWGQKSATQPARRVADEGRSREAFRPVALPALAAAVHVSSAATQAARARRLAALNLRLFVHEDDPVA